jgi:drug/metabolite transporter (DMT)-like permease
MNRYWANYVENITSAQATSFIVLAAICFGLVPWFARELLDRGMASPAVAFYRYSLTALIFFPVLRVSGPLKKELLWSLASGVCIGLGWLGYIEALKVAPVAPVSVIYMTYPIFTLLVSWLLVRNEPDKRSLGAGFLILLASIIAFTPEGLSDTAQRALLIAFIAPMAFGMAISVLTDKLHNLKPLQRLAGFTTGASLGLLPLILNLEVDQVIPQDTALWKYIIGLAFLTALLPQYIYGTMAPLVGPGRTAMAGSVELPTMFIIGFLVFGESISFLQILSGLLVMTAIVITPAISSKRRVVAIEPEEVNE